MDRSSSQFVVVFFFSSRGRHTRYIGDWSSDVCSSDLSRPMLTRRAAGEHRPARAPAAAGADRKSVGEGKRVDLGGRRIIKKKKKDRHLLLGHLGDLPFLNFADLILFVDAGPLRHGRGARQQNLSRFFFFKQKTAYEIHR